MQGTGPVTPSGQTLLDVQREHANSTTPGTLERAMTEETGLSPTRCYQLLNALLEDEQAWQYDPLTVALLRRRRAARMKRMPRSA